MAVNKADSTTVTGAAAQAEAAPAAGYRGKARTPYEVLKQLPEDATPEQQDSAIQANFHVVNTHLSTRPDTLTLPGQEKWTRPGEVVQPEAYIDRFFRNDSTFRPEIGNSRSGIAGDPVPYTIQGDNTLTALLIGCFIIAMLAFANTRRFITIQAKQFFRGTKNISSDYSETSAEVRSQSFFVLLTCLLFAIISFIYTLENVADTFILSSQYQLVAVFFGIYVAYFGFRLLVYWAVNSVFFGSRKSVKWLKSLLFATSMEGVALFPLVLLVSYFDLSMQKAIIYVFFVIALVKMSLLYKSFIVFFKHKAFFLQIILYFCALEIMPLLALWGVLVNVVDYLKINF